MPNDVNDRAKVSSAAPQFDPVTPGNHGTVKSSFPTNGEGKTIILEPYGKDDSDYNAPNANYEQNAMRGLGGSIDNLAHSLTGVSANQTGKGRR